MRYQFPCFWPLGLSFVLKGEQRTQLASECFEPCQPQRMISGLKTTFSLISYVIHPTSHSTTSLFFSNPNSNFTYNFGTQTLKNNNTCFGAYLYSADTQHGNLRQLSVTMSRLTYFHPPGPHRKSCQPQLTQEKLGRGFGKNVCEWTGKVKISKG